MKAGHLRSSKPHDCRQLLVIIASPGTVTAMHMTSRPLIRAVRLHGLKPSCCSVQCLLKLTLPACLGIFVTCSRGSQSCSSARRHSQSMDGTSTSERSPLAMLHCDFL